MHNRIISQKISALCSGLPINTCIYQQYQTRLVHAWVWELAIVLMSMTFITLIHQLVPCITCMYMYLIYVFSHSHPNTTTSLSATIIVVWCSIDTILQTQSGPLRPAKVEVVDVPRPLWHSKPYVLREVIFEPEMLRLKELAAPIIASIKRKDSAGNCSDIAKLH